MQYEQFIQQINYHQPVPVSRVKSGWIFAFGFKEIEGRHVYYPIGVFATLEEAKLRSDFGFVITMNMWYYIHHWVIDQNNRMTGRTAGCGGPALIRPIILKNGFADMVYVNIYSAENQHEENLVISAEGADKIDWKICPMCNIPFPDSFKYQLCVECAEHIEHGNYNDNMEEAFKREMMAAMCPGPPGDPIYTCFGCADKDTCPLAWDWYNVDGDCIMK